MSDPQHLGLGELGQRVQAMSDPVADSRLRPYQGAPLPVGPAPNGRPLSSFEPREDLRTTPPSLPPAASPQSPAQAYNPYPNPPFQPGESFSGQLPGHASVRVPISDIGSASAPATRRVPVWENVGVPTHSVEPAPASPQTSHPTQPANLPNVAPLSTSSDPNAPKSGLQRAIDAVRSTLPLVQKLLPLLDSNFATTLGALVAPQTHQHPPPPPIQVDLEPVERGLTEVRTSHRELRGQVLEQGTTLKRVEDQLERVREATDRNTLEQQELVEDLRSVGSRISAFAVIGLILLTISLGLNIFFLIQLQHILR